MPCLFPHSLDNPRTKEVSLRTCSLFIVHCSSMWNKSIPVKTLLSMPCFICPWNRVIFNGLSAVSEKTNLFWSALPFWSIVHKHCCSLRGGCKKSPIADMSAFFQFIGKLTISKNICKFLTLFCALLTPVCAF